MKKLLVVLVCTTMFAFGSCAVRSWHPDSHTSVVGLTFDCGDVDCQVPVFSFSH